MKKKPLIQCFPVLLALLFAACDEGNVSSLNTLDLEGGEATAQEEAGGPKAEAEAELPTEGEEEVDLRYTYLEAYGGKVFYVNVNGTAYFEGDIVLGTTEEMEEMKAEFERAEAEGEAPDTAYSLITNRTTGIGRPWPNNTMYYSIASGLPNQQRITDAIKHFHANTNLRLVPRTNQTDYVSFQNGSGCSSYIGIRGGKQVIELANGCSLGNTIHEIGHAAGLWHEHSRADRDTYITIHTQNIEKGKERNFDKRDNTAKEFGAYDYGSIMHYGRTAFGKKDVNAKELTTITPKNSSATIGQRTKLSSGDIAGLNALYPLPPVCTFSSKPASIPDKGGTYSFTVSCSRSPTSYAWTLNGALQSSKTSTFSYSFSPILLSTPKTHTIAVTASNNGGSGKASVTLTQK